MTTTDGKRWFVTDRAIDDPGQDAFSHDDVAGQLAVIVGNITPPATVGLLGGFGTGKSSIGNLLAKRLTGHATLQVVTLSAEKHSDTARQRAIVYSLAEALRDDAGVDDKKIQRVLGRIEQSEDVEGPELDAVPLLGFIKANRRALVSAAAVGLAAAATLWLVGVLVSILLRLTDTIDENPLTFPITSGYRVVPLVVGLFGTLGALGASWGRAALTPRSITRSRPRAEAADELERVFADLVLLVKKRLVIVVDDIDRLAPNQVLQALATIKTLQAVPRSHPPVFVISCDDKVVRKAIQDADPGISRVDGSERVAAEEYLNKLFVVRQPLPPHLKEDMRKYAMAVLTSDATNHAGPEHLGTSLRGVLEILIHDGVNDPRHVIRLLNAYFTDYRLARVREGPGGRLGAGEVTGNPLMLARLTVLRVDFTDYYEMIRDEFELLRALDLKVVGAELDQSQQRLLDEAAQAAAEDRDADGEARAERPLPVELADFLRRTARYVERGVPLAPFFFLGQTAAGRILGSQQAEDIRRALENNDSAAVRRRLVDDESVAAATVDHIVATLGGSRPGIPLTNAVATTAGVLNVVPSDHQGRLANELAAIIAREPEAAPPPAQLADVARYADAVHHHDLTSRLVELEGDVERATERAAVILKLAAERPADSLLVGGLDTYFSNLADQVGWVEASKWLPQARDVEPVLRSQILPSSFYAAMVHSAVGAGEETIPREDADTFTALLDQAPAIVRTSAEVAAAVKDCGLAAGSEPRWFAVHVLAHLDPGADEADLLLRMVGDIVTDSAVECYEDTLVDAMDLLVAWSTTRRDRIEAGSDETAAAVIAALTVTAASTSEEVLRSAAAAIACVGAIRPGIRPAIDALAVSLDGHRSIENTTGRALQDALVALVPAVGLDERTAIVTALLAPLATAESETDPAAQLAIESIPLIASTDSGRELVAASVPAWRQRFSAGIASVNSVRAQVMALQSAARHGAVSNEEQQSLVERLVGLLAQGGVMQEAAALGLAAIPWTSERSQVATEAIAGSWEPLTRGMRTEVAERVANWPPGESALHVSFSEVVTTHLLGVDDLNAVGVTVDALWPALSGPDKARVAAERIADIAAIRAKIPEMSPQELLETLRRASITGSVAAVAEAARSSPEQVRRETVPRFLQAAFDDADFGWSEIAVRAVIADLMPPEAASDCVTFVVAHLDGGAAQADRAAVALAALKAAHPTAGAAANEAIVSAVETLLPVATVEVAERLGLAARGIPKSRFEDLWKGIRKNNRDDQERRAAVDAFEKALRDRD